MADNVELPPMSGGDIFAADDLGTVKVQRIKVGWGADGAYTDTNAAQPLPVNVGAAGTVSTGVATVATAGTAVQLPNLTSTGVTVRAPISNVAAVYVGPSGVTAATGFPLYPGDSLSLDITNTNLIYVNADTNNDKVRYVRVAP